jgi:hypothetical protein
MRLSEQPLPSKLRAGGAPFPARSWVLFERQQTRVHPRFVAAPTKPDSWEGYATGPTISSNHILATVTKEHENQQRLLSVLHGNYPPVRQLL